MFSQIQSPQILLHTVVTPHRYYYTQLSPHTDTTTHSCHFLYFLIRSPHRYYYTQLSLSILSHPFTTQILLHTAVTFYTFSSGHHTDTTTHSCHFLYFLIRSPHRYYYTQLSLSILSHPVTTQILLHTAVTFYTFSSSPHTDTTTHSCHFLYFLIWSPHRYYYTQLSLSILSHPVPTQTLLRTAVTFYTFSSGPHTDTTTHSCYFLHFLIRSPHRYYYTQLSLSILSHPVPTQILLHTAVTFYIFSSGHHTDTTTHSCHFLHFLIRSPHRYYYTQLSLSILSHPVPTQILLHTAVTFYTFSSGHHTDTTTHSCHFLHFLIRSPHRYYYTQLSLSILSHPVPTHTQLSLSILSHPVTTQILLHTAVTFYTFSSGHHRDTTTHSCHFLYLLI